LREDDAVLRALGAGDAGFDGGEIEGEKFGIFGFGVLSSWKRPCSRQ